jgi:hypothetical protein
MSLVFSCGPFLVVDLPEHFRDLAKARVLVFGAVMILMTIFRKGRTSSNPAVQL